MDILGFILHVDTYLGQIITLFGPWTYGILFGVIFAETGLVVTPFLPGDSLLFAMGALAGGGYLDLWTLYVVVMVAALAGDNVNYWIGHHIGPRVFASENSRLFNKAYLEKTREFYERHGGKTIILARFMPIVRTFAPFVAGVGRMRYATFITYSMAGAAAWALSLITAGYLFGGLPFVRDNFETVVLGIIAVSLLPMVAEYVRHRRGPRMTPAQMEHATYRDIRETMHREHLDD